MVKRGCIESQRSERQINKLLVDLVRAHGGKAYKWISPGNNGVPDRLVVMPGGKIYMVEVKAFRGKISARQNLVQAELRSLGCDVRVVRRYSDVIEFVKEVSGQDAVVSG